MYTEIKQILKKSLHPAADTDVYRNEINTPKVYPSSCVHVYRNTKDTQKVSSSTCGYGCVLK